MEYNRLLQESILGIISGQIKDHALNFSIGLSISTAAIHSAKRVK